MELWNIILKGTEETGAELKGHLADSHYPNLSLFAAITFCLEQKDGIL